MVYSEPCTIGPDGTLFDPRQGKNEALTLCVGSDTSYFPVLEK